jgi:hypothetical protein
MTDRQRAQQLLQEAKEALAQRLTELVLQAGEDLVADARGESYMNEIETLYEQVGMKLAHLNQMLSNLPAEPPAASAATAPVPPWAAPQDTFTVATEPAPSADAVVADTTPALLGPVFVATPALPAPRTEPATEGAPQSFQRFAERIAADDISGAGQVLAALLGLSKGRATACARTFARHVHRDPDFQRKVAQLRHELHAGSYHGAIALLVDCFGLSGVEALGVMGSLRRRLEGG